MGANLSVLASLMQSMAEANNIRPWDEAQRSMNQAETGLLQLQEMRRQQATAARTRQFLQEHPELVLGQGGGSVLGSLQQPPAGSPALAPTAQTQVMPGQPPGPPQMVPGGQDLSRFANVPPTGGGPIPPNVMGQVMPTVTPPPGTPTLATLGQPQGPTQALQNRFLLDLARTSPDAAMQVQQLMQGQQDRQFKLEEQRLDWTSKKMGYFGQVLQGVNSPESYAAAVQEIGRVDAQAAARLPQTYSKEALIPYIKQATTVKENADLQIRTMHEQTEQGKLQVQLAQAGYQGLGDDVTSILKGYNDEQVKQFGGRTSPAAIQNAVKQAREQKPVPGQTADVTTELRVMKKDPWTASGDDLAQARKNIEERELIRTRAAEVQRGKTEQELRGEKTLSETMGTKATNLFDTRTLDPVDTRMKQKDYEALPAGQVRELSPQLTEQITNIRTSVPIIAQLQGHIDKIYGPGGVLERMTPDERADLAAVPGRWAKQYAQKYPEVAQAQRFIDSNASGLARALAGEKGAMAEGDVERAKAMLPNLETTLKVWPPANIGIQSPDTRAVALGSMNNIVDMINGRVRTILGNEQFTHPKLHRYETAQEVQAAGGDPRTQPTLPPEERPIPPQVGPNPHLAPVPPTFGPGDPTQQLRPRPPVPPVTPPTSSTGKEYGRLMTPPTPGTGSQAAPAPAPATRPAPPTATSTPAQDDAYRQAQGQGRPQAPAPTTARPTPGRQSQAPTGTRLAGGPKYMELRDVQEAMRQTGKSRREIEARARELGYIVYGSKRPLPEETMVG